MNHQKISLLQRLTLKDFFSVIFFNFMKNKPRINNENIKKFTCVSSFLEVFNQKVIQETSSISETLYLCREHFLIK